ncbi:hypothetical protein BH09MYX1_BH09MYX1_33850 [soil metagenome]
MTLHDFLLLHRDEILARSRVRLPPEPESSTLDAKTTGQSAFLDHLSGALHRAATRGVVEPTNLEESTTEHGRDLFQRGLTVAQVVHKYGDLCQAITGLALELDAPMEVAEFKTLNLCLDDAIAGAVTAFQRQRDRVIAGEGTERIGMLAHEMRNALSGAMMSFDLIQRGVVAPGGSTAAIHARSLVLLSSLVERSLADVRLEAGLQKLEPVPIWEIIAEVEMSASMVAKTRGLQLSVTAVDHSAMVAADRQILAATLTNLLQNAFKFTRPATTVWLRTSTSTDRVVIEVEDQCGGLPPNAVANMLKPFVQHGRDRTGLGLGLTICAKAVKAMAGELRVVDLPGKGCIFAVDLPKLGVPFPTAQLEPPTFEERRALE